MCQEIFTPSRLEYSAGFHDRLGFVLFLFLKANRTISSENMILNLKKEIILVALVTLI